MIYLICTTIFFIIVTVVLASIACENHSDGFGISAVIVGVVAIIFICFCTRFCFEYKSASYKAKIINREYGTEYTQEDVFYAESVIDTIRELDRKRIELNSNIITNGKCE